MAETLAVVSLASAIVQFVDFSTKIVVRLNKYQSSTADLPKALQAIKTQLPLIINTLEQTKAQTEDGSINKCTQEAILAVVRGCHSGVEVLNTTLGQLLPLPGDSKWKRRAKAFSTICQERKIQQIATTLRDYIEILTYHQATSLGVSKYRSANDIFMVPFERDNSFVDRTDILAEISNRFSSSRRVALTGIGGVGKSQIAIEYCYRFRENNPHAHVYWVHGSSIARFEQDYRAIARKLSLSGHDDQDFDIFQSVSEFLSDQANGTWLLVLDNVDDSELVFGCDVVKSFTGKDSAAALFDYLPQSNNSLTLMTTRDSRVGERLTNREMPIIVPLLQEAEARDLLRKKLPQSFEDETIRSHLIDELEYLPLAITQAAAFISENGINVGEYIQLLRQSDLDMKELLFVDLVDSRRDSGASHSVIRTWKLSFDQIMSQKPRAAQILCLMSVLDRQGVSKRLITRDGEGSVELTTALGMLKAFSFIHPKRGEDTLEMHRLVQISIQKWLELSGSLTKWKQEALELLSRRFPLGKYEQWMICEMLYSHANVVLSYNIESTSSLLQRATILLNTSSYDCQRGNYINAQERAEESLEIRDRLLGSEHTDTLASMDNLAGVLDGRGKYDKSARIYTRAISVKEALIGTEDLSTVTSMNGLAGVLLRQGRYKEAQRLYGCVLETRKTILGVEHPETLRTWSSLASAMSSQCNYEAAEQASREVLEIRGKVLGAEHPDTLSSINNLAVLLPRQGKMEEAMNMYRLALDGRSQTLGLKHPSTLSSMMNLATLLNQQEKYGEAEGLYRQALMAEESVLGAKHLSTLITTNNLAVCLVKQRKYREAETLYMDAWKCFEEKFGPAHPMTESCKNDLSDLRNSWGVEGPMTR